MLHNILGRAKSGKTEYVLSLCERLINEKKHTFLIVPEQGALAYERGVIERLGNRSNEYIEVISFKRLCNRVFRETGGLTQKYIDSAHKLLLMYKAIKEARGLLCEYKGASENPDFVGKALHVINEFRTYGVSVEALEKFSERLEGTGSERLCGKLRDFALIYTAYNRISEEIFGKDYDCRDSNDDLERLASVLCDSKFFRGKSVIIDSFYSFTVPEISVIDRIIRDADEAYVTYLYEKGKDNILFARGKKAYEKISRLASDNFIDSEDIVTDFGNGYLDENLKNLERTFAFELLEDKPELCSFSGSGVKLYKCKSIYDEAKITAAIINKLTREGARYSDITVLSRNPDELCGIFDTELSENEIPFGFSVKYDLLTRPVASYIVSAFEFSRTKSTQSVLRILKTGLTALSDTQADLTECYIKTWDIKGKGFTDMEWTMNPDGYNAISEMSPRNAEILEIVRESQKLLITPLSVFDEEIRDAASANEISEAIVRFLESGKYNPDTISEEEAVYHNMVMDTLDCIADICGSDFITPAEYASMFEMILSAYDTGRIPATVDEVTVANAELFRATKNDYTIIVGLNDGNFPRNPSADNVFSDKERVLLRDIGLELSGTTADLAYDELFLAYKAISSASKGLFLLYSESDMDGNECKPSSVVSMCKTALDGLEEEKADAVAALKMYLSDKSLVSEMTPENPELTKALEKYLASKGINPKSAADSYQKYLSENTSGMLFGRDIMLSPSRLEKFNNCACSYFGTYTLALSPERTASLGPAESGNIIHKILELLIAELSEKKQKGEEITPEYAIEREHALLDAYVTDLVGEKAEKELSRRFRYLYKRLTGALDACVNAMTRELMEAEFVPVDFEMSIGGRNADVPFSSIPIFDSDGNENGTLTINGKVDRTDIYKKDGKVYVRVDDYKTGSKKFNLNDVSSGINLQMLLYLYSLTKNAGPRYGNGEIIPAGVLYTPIHRPTYSYELGEDNGKDEKNDFKTNGILIDRMEALTAMEKNLEGKYIPVKLNKDGSFNSYSSVITLETMGRLLSCAAEVASKLAGEMKSGKIAKNPYRCEHNSCTYCDLAPFCRYENGEDGTRYTMTKYTDEVFEKSTGGDGNG